MYTLHGGCVAVGLDTVEFVMEIEATFGIRLLDAEAERVSTFGDLHALVLRKLVRGARCLTSAVFYRLRRALVTALAVERRAVRPAVSTETLVAAEGRAATGSSRRTSPRRARTTCGLLS